MRRHTTLVCLVALMILAVSAPGQTTWLSTSPVPSPAARYSHALAYDSSRARVVLFGGYGTTYLADTWEYNGVTWQAIFPTTSPLSRFGHALAYDSTRGKVVLFGGGRGVLLSDTWEYDGVNWQQTSPGTIPPARYSHALAYDSSRGKVVLFGGVNTAGALLGDTWEYDGVTWQQVLGAGPPARAAHALAYDSARARVVLFGGQAGASPTATIADTWEFNGLSWQQRFLPTSPLARRGHALAYDAARSAVVLFGGDRNNGTLVSDTWAYDGLTWSSLSPTASPPARSFHSIAYDINRLRTVLFGGAGGSFADTWELTNPSAIGIAGTVRMIAPTGPPVIRVSGATVEVRRLHTTIATTTTDAQGYYSVTLPLGAVPGMYTIRTTLTGIGGGHPPVVNYRYPDPVTQAPVANPDGDLIQLQSGSNPNMDMLVPKPVILVHGVLSSSASWQDPSPTEVGFESMLRQDPAFKWQSYGRADRGYIAFSIGYDAGPALYAHLYQTLDSSAGVFSGNLSAVRVTWSVHVPSSAPIDIVAHSMGGLVTRAYLHNHAALNSVDRVFTLGTPHIGQFSILFGAWWYSLPIPVALQQMDPVYLYTQFQPTHSQTAGARFVLVGASSDLNPIEPEGWLPPGNPEEDDSLVSTFSSVQYPFYQIPGLNVLAMHTVPDIHWSLNNNSPPGGNHGTLFWVMTALETLH